MRALDDLVVTLVVRTADTHDHPPALRRLEASLAAARRVTVRRSFENVSVTLYEPAPP